MNNDYNILGLCRRAGKLCIGHDATIEAVKSGTAELVLLTSDASSRHLKELEALGFCDRIMMLSDDMETVGYYVGKRSCILAVTDKGFAGSIYKKLNNNQ